MEANGWDAIPITLTKNLNFRRRCSEVRTGYQIEGCETNSAVAKMRNSEVEGKSSS